MVPLVSRVLAGPEPQSSAEIVPRTHVWCCGHPLREYSVSVCLRVPRVATNPELEETRVRLPVPDALLDDILETGHLLGVTRRRQEHELGIKSNVTTLGQIDARTTPVLSKASRTLPLNAEQTQHIEDRSHNSQ